MEILRHCDFYSSSQNWRWHSLRPWLGRASPGDFHSHPPVPSWAEWLKTNKESSYNLLVIRAVMVFFRILKNLSPSLLPVRKRTQFPDLDFCVHLHWDEEDPSMIISTLSWFHKRSFSMKFPLKRGNLQLSGKENRWFSKPDFGTMGSI